LIGTREKEKFRKRPSDWGKRFLGRGDEVRAKEAKELKSYALFAVRTLKKVRWYHPRRENRISIHN